MSELHDSRAKNVHRYRWAGDPERWGAHSEVTINVPAPGILPRPPMLEYTQQVLRTQPEDLVAISWDLVSTWTLDGLDPGDSGALALEVTIGSGQTRSTLLWLLSTIVAGVATTQNAGAATLGWLPDPPSGTRQAGVAVSAQPIMANALSARARLLITVDAAAPAHVVALSLNAHCAPRSWVP